MKISFKQTLEYSFRGKFDIIYRSTVDMRKFGAFHPYMEEVKIVNEAGDYTEYSIKERLMLFGFIPQRPEYNAKVFEIEKNKRIQYISMVKPSLPLTINFTFSTAEGYTKLTEEIAMGGNRFICSVLFGIMKKAHQVLFERMEKHALTVHG